MRIDVDEGPLQPSRTEKPWSGRPGDGPEDDFGFAMDAGNTLIYSQAADWIEGRWRVILDWTLVNGRPECVGVQLKSFRDPGDAEDLPFPLQGDAREIVTAELLRALPIGSFIKAARAEWAAEFQKLADSRVQRRGREQLRRWAELWAEPPGSAQEGLQRAADVYRVAWESGQNPTATVAQLLHLSPSAAAKRVARARQAGLLPPTVRGKAKGSS